jgi:FixJ family two-component response regulator
MPYHAEEEVKVFAGIDVSAGELSVALLRSKEDEETTATFTNTRSGHKALLAHLLRGNQRVRVCLEALGMAVKTVETHRSNMMKRLNCHSLGELVRYALRNQIIHP